MNADPEARGNGHQTADDRPAHSSSSAHADGRGVASDVQSVPTHHSTIAKQLLIDRSRDLLVDHWVCQERRHTVCFVDRHVHRCMTDRDIDDWAEEIHLARATLYQPPTPLLSQWADRDAPLARTSFEHAHNSQSTFSLDATISSTSTPEDIASELSIPRGGFYLAGSGIKGIGNLIIGGITWADAVYRRRRARALLKLADIQIHRHNQAQQKTAFSRILWGLVTPSKQLHSLLDDLIDLQGLSIVHILCLHTCLDDMDVPMTAYMQLKWAFISIRVDNPESLLFQRRRPFSDRYSSDDQAVRYATLQLQRTYQICHGTEKTAVTFMLGAIRKDGDVGAASRSRSWGAVANIVELTGPSHEVNKILHQQYEIHFHDPRMELDCDPECGPSMWGECCSRLAVIPKIVDWNADAWPGAILVARVMEVLAHAHDARRRSLSRANAILPVLESVPEDMWEAVSAELQTSVLYVELYRRLRAFSEYKIALAKSPAHEFERYPYTYRPRIYQPWRRLEGVDYCHLGACTKEFALHLARELEGFRH